MTIKVGPGTLEVQSHSPRLPRGRPGAPHGWDKEDALTSHK